MLILLSLANALDLHDAAACRHERDAGFPEAVGKPDQAMRLEFSD